MKQVKPLLIVLLGPTASGKTDLAIEIAETLKIDIHNIDSRQLYKGMDIGTAKPTKSQQNRIKHLLIDLREPNQPITLHEFQKIAKSSLEQTFKSSNIGILVGGSGLYLKSLTSGFCPPKVPPQPFLREQLQKIGQRECHQILQKCDDISAQKIYQADSVRTIRALEVLYGTGQPISALKTTQTPSWRCLEIGLDTKKLPEKILLRTKRMYENGLIQETKALCKRFGNDLPLLQTIGYKEALSTIQGEISINDAIEMTARRTRQFAKKQRTWFKKQHNATWLNETNPREEALTLIQNVIG